MNSNEIYFDFPQLLTLLSLVLGMSSAFWLIKSEVKKLAGQESEMRRLNEKNQKEIEIIDEEVQKNRLEMVEIRTEFKQIQLSQNEIKMDLKKLLSLVNTRG